MGAACSLSWRTTGCANELLLGECVHMEVCVSVFPSKIRVWDEESIDLKHHQLGMRTYQKGSSEALHFYSAHSSGAQHRFTFEETAVMIQAFEQGQADELKYPLFKMLVHKESGNTPHCHISQSYNIKENDRSLTTILITKACKWERLSWLMHLHTFAC